MIPIRTPGPMAPKRISFKFYLAMALIAWAGGMLPEVGHSTPAVARGVYSDLGTPVTQIIALRAPDWARTPDAYQPLPMREERLNALFNSAVDALLMAKPSTPAIACWALRPACTIPSTRWAPPAR